jgi:hypothetical protein
MKLDEMYIQNIPKMNFALLLVMLMRENGKVTLTQEDMDLADDERHNICFALSLDGTALEVSVVSAQSGIIRSPEATAWAQPNQQTQAPHPGANQFQPPSMQYQPPPPPPELSEEEARRLQALNIVEGWQRSQFPAAGADGGQPRPELESSQPPNRIVEMPAAKQTPAMEKVFPFQVGTSPQDARQVNLSEMQNQLLRKDHEIAQEEAAAAERVERSV